MARRAGIVESGEKIIQLVDQVRGTQLRGARREPDEIGHYDRDEVVSVSDVRLTSVEPRDDACRKHVKEQITRALPLHIQFFRHSAQQGSVGIAEQFDLLEGHLEPLDAARQAQILPGELSAT